MAAGHTEGDSHRARQLPAEGCWSIFHNSQMEGLHFETENLCPAVVAVTTSWLLSITGIGVVHFADALQHSPQGSQGAYPSQLQMQEI